MSKISCEPPDTLFVLKDRLVRYIIVACDLDYQGGGGRHSRGDYQNMGKIGSNANYDR